MKIKVRGRKTYQAGDSNGRPVGPAHEQPPQDDPVEGSIGAAGQEPVQLFKEKTPGRSGIQVLDCSVIKMHKLPFQTSDT